MQRLVVLIENQSMQKLTVVDNGLQHRPPEVDSKAVHSKAPLLPIVNGFSWFASGSINSKELSVSTDNDEWLATADQVLLEFLSERDVAAIYVGLETGSFVGMSITSLKRTLSVVVVCSFLMCWDVLKCVDVLRYVNDGVE